MRARRLLLAALLCAAPLLRAGSAEEGGRAEPARALAAAAGFNVLGGDFSQTKQVKGFQRPLRSRGHFILWRGHGVLWSITKPFASDVCVDAKGLWQLQRRGAGWVRSAVHRGDMSLALGLVQTLLSGDRAALAAAFEIGDLKAPEGRWALRLTPRDTGLRRALSGLTVEGAERVQSVVYDEANGDRTEITFSRVEARESLAPGEAGAFGD